MKMTVEIAVPEDARYMAKDNDGEWCFYTHKPHCNYGIWNANEGRMTFAYRDVLCTEEEASQELYELVWK